MINGMGTSKKMKGFVVDNKVNLPLMLSLLVALAGGFVFFDNLGDRIAILETNYDNMNQRILSLIERQINVDREQDDELQLFRQEIRQDVQTINQKLDRIIENYQ